MKRVTSTSIRPSTAVIFYGWSQEAVIKFQQKYWTTGKIKSRLSEYSDDALTSINTSIYTDEGWATWPAETDPDIIAAITAGMVWNTDHGIATSTVVQDI